VCKDFVDAGGGYLFKSITPSTFFPMVYPEYDWLPWKFNKCPPSYWEIVNNQKRFMEWAAKELDIKEKSDWYKVSSKVTYKDFQVKN
jgi:hypothetical protein